MPNTKTVDVAHLGGNDAGYQMPHPYDPAKPTLVLVNSFATSSGLYRGQHANKQLTEKMNLLTIEFLGHGKTRTKNENFTYWDTAIMNLQVMEALGVKKAFVLSTSQGGWITVRMALLVPDRVGQTTGGREGDRCRVGFYALSTRSFRHVVGTSLDPWKCWRAI